MALRVPKVSLVHLVCLEILELRDPMVSLVLREIKVTPDLLVALENLVHLVCLV